MYRVHISPKEGTKFNPIHEEFNNVSAQVLNIEVGQKGFFTAQSKEDNEWYGIHTSIIEEVKDYEDSIKVTTRNTVYLFVEEF